MCSAPKILLDDNFPIYGTSSPCNVWDFVFTGTWPGFHFKKLSRGGETWQLKSSKGGIWFSSLVLDHTTCSPQVHKEVRFWQEGANSPPKWSPVYMYMYVILNSRQWNNNILETILGYVLAPLNKDIIRQSCVNSELLSQLKPVYLNLVSWPARTRLPPRNSLVNEVEFLGLITQKR